MNILIIGTGYVGLVTGTCFAEMGHNVTCLDIDENKIDALQEGIIPFYEPGLKDLVKKNSHKKRLLFSCDYEESVPKADAIFVAVPTPSESDGSCDLKYFRSAVKSIAQHMSTYTVIVNKSTVPVGSTSEIHDLIKSELSTRNVLVEFDMVSNPEFLKEGSAVTDCLSPDRIIVGLSSVRARAVMEKIYLPLTVKGSTLIVMDPCSAEMTKYAANSMLATRISFMNELSRLCEKVGANIDEVKIGIGSDKRIGPYFLNAGIGYGGSCFPKDIKALQAQAKSAGIELSILKAVDQVNKTQKDHIINIIEGYFSDKGGITNKTIGIWGLAFKPETDDMREAPSIDIISKLYTLGANIKVFDPISQKNARYYLSNYPKIVWSENQYATCENADAVILVTEWSCFLTSDLSLVYKKMSGKGFFDGRNAFDKQKMKELGFDYYNIGTPSIDQQLEITTW
ncbi:MAG: UDP-glucose/GDP-mannose dehydrogenase family protein [Chlamydiae bacterium]|nr:UDP-glucose/GDP-mannose dehydrogenase family protein [Chlamydiota bacterium]